MRTAKAQIIRIRNFDQVRISLLLIQVFNGSVIGQRISRVIRDFVAHTNHVVRLMFIFSKVLLSFKLYVLDL